MRQPFWIVNSILLLELLASTYFILFMPVKVPNIKSITPVALPQSQVIHSDVQDYSLIYLNDLFGTKSQPTELTEEFSVESDNFPLAPELSQPEGLAPFAAPFLEPLNINLTGIMTFGNNQENIAIILDQTTKEEVNYRIGDRVQDAQIINITKHKVELLRNNGQQETLYLYQRKAKSDMEKTDINWNKFIQTTGYHQIAIDLDQFTDNVKNLGNLIELLDLTTAFQDGENLGCRIGQAGYKTLGNALGFETGDIILAIADIPTKSTKDRFEIYQKLTNNSNSTVPATSLDKRRDERDKTDSNSSDQDYHNSGDSNNLTNFTIELLRHNQPIKITYNITDEEPEINLRNRLIPAPSTTRSTQEISEAEFVLPDHPKDLKINDLKREAQVPASVITPAAAHTDTLEKIKQQDRQRMLKAQGGAHV
jgi:general secretion pathway protein C